MKPARPACFTALILCVLCGCAPQKEQARVTLTEYYSPSCETCVEMMPVIDAVEREFKGRVPVIKISLDTKEGALKASELSLKTIPALIFSDFQGVAYYRHDGKITKEEIEKIIKLKL